MMSPPESSVPWRRCSVGDQTAGARPAGATGGRKGQVRTMQAGAVGLNNGREQGQEGAGLASARSDRWVIVLCIYRLSPGSEISTAVRFRLSSNFDCRPISTSVRLELAALSQQGCGSHCPPRSADQDSSTPHFGGHWRMCST